MNEVTLSPKYQVVIPREIRDGMTLFPGDRMRVFRYGERIEIVPVRDISELEGMLKGIDTEVEREGDRL
jgi:AbrB family looped-hinge helix DNA binding protein